MLQNSENIGKKKINRIKNFLKKNWKNWKDFNINQKIWNNIWIISKNNNSRKIFLLKNNFKKILFFIIFLFFSILLFFIFFSNYFSISEINFKRKDFSFNPENISKQLEKEIWKNIFFVNTFILEKEIEEKNPQFKKISLNKIFPDKLSFEVFNFKNIFEIHSYFTKENKDTWVKEKFIQNFLISQAGELKNFPDNFSKNTSQNISKINQNNNLNKRTWSWKILNKKLKKTSDYKIINQKLKKIFIKEDLWKKLEIWEKFIDWKILSKIQKINSYLEENEKLKIQDIYFWPKWKELHFNTDKWVFEFTLSKEIESQLEKIFYFKESKNIKNFNKKEFKYLDLRISDKIIYKK